MLQLEGIVMRLVRYKESSLILDMYTDKLGMQSFVMNGVFSRGNQRLAALFQLSNILDFVCYYHENKTLHRIKEARSSIIYQHIHSDIVRSAVTSFMLELCRKSIYEKQSNPELFTFLKTSFVNLDRIEKLEFDFHLRFSVELLQFIGFSPQTNYSERNNSFDLENSDFTPYNSQNKFHILPEYSFVFYQLLTAQKAELKLDTRRKIMDLIILYYKMHIDQFGEMKSPEIYKTIFG